LHGEWGRQWDDFLGALAAERRVIAPCHPGFGETTGTDQLLDLPDLIYYYLDFLDALDLRGLPLVGHGLGGMLAAELAAVQPERFSRLVLIGPLGLWNPAYPVLDFFAAAPDELAAATYHDPESPVARAAAAVPAEGEPYVNYMLERAKSLATAAKYLWPIPNRGLNKRLHRIRIPTLLVWGESDGICPPRYAADFQAAIPHAERAIVAKAGHLPQTERPGELAEIVSKFI
jgi:pimeloyl-ACP methyl ester carboxylesterase